MDDGKGRAAPELRRDDGLARSARPEDDDALDERRLVVNRR
jgi:hypothetical protein